MMCFLVLSHRRWQFCKLIGATSGLSSDQFPTGLMMVIDLFASLSHHSVLGWLLWQLWLRSLLVRNLHKSSTWLQTSGIIVALTCLINILLTRCLVRIKQVECLWVIRDHLWAFTRPFRTRSQCMIPNPGCGSVRSTRALSGPTHTKPCLMVHIPRKHLLLKMPASFTCLLLCLHKLGLMLVEDQTRMIAWVTIGLFRTWLFGEELSVFVVLL